MNTLHGREIADAELADWVFLLGSLHTRLATGSFDTGLRLVAAIGAASEEIDHHPDLDLRYRHLGIRLRSHDVDGVTARDLRLARTISELAAAEGVLAEPMATQQLELALDTPDAASLLPFWRAVLDMDVGNAAGEDPDLHHASLPSIWFQASGGDEPRQRFHLDLWVAPEVVAARIDAAVAAGGVLVSDDEAPSFWVLADAEGNKVCLCTWQDRDVRSLAGSQRPPGRPFQGPGQMT